MQNAKRGIDESGIVGCIIRISKEQRLLGEVIFANYSEKGKESMNRVISRVDAELMVTKAVNGRVIVPEGIVEIGVGAFSANEDLKEVVLPGTLKHICADAFSGCKNLKNVYASYTVEAVDEGVFENCPELVVRCENETSTYEYCISNNIRYSTAGCKLFDFIHMLENLRETYMDDDSIQNVV